MNFTDKIAEQGWTLAIGDPALIGWSIFTGYLLAAALCVRAGVSAMKSVEDSERMKSALLWFGLSMLLLLLGMNKQLDLQALLTLTGKIIARSQGWYGERRAVQKVFVLVFGLAGLGSFAVLFKVFKRQLLENRTALIGIFLLGSFVLIRAAKFQHVDFIPEWLAVIGSVRMKYVLESAGIICVGYSALRRIRNNRIRLSEDSTHLRD